VQRAISSIWVMCVAACAAAMAHCTAVAGADPPDPSPQPIVGPLAPGQVVRIGPTAGTGTPTRDYGIGATDLCEFMEFPTELLQVCGDSFAGQGVGFGGWFSPVALHVDRASVDSPDGVRYTGVTGVDKPLLADATPPGSSQLPAGVIEINRQNYLLVTTTNHLVPFVALALGTFALERDADKLALDGALRAARPRPPAERTWSWLLLVARLFLGSIFVAQGLANALTPGGPVAFARVCGDRGRW